LSQILNNIAFPNFRAALQVLPTLAIYNCERSFTIIKDYPLLYPTSRPMGQDRLSDLALSLSH